MAKEIIQTRFAIESNGTKVELIHNEGASQILVKVEGQEKGYFIPSPYTKLSTKTLAELAQGEMEKMNESNNTITVYGRTYELDFSQQGSVLLTYTSKGNTTLARVAIKTNEHGIEYACQRDLSLAASGHIGKRAQIMILGQLNGIINNMRLERIEKEAQKEIKPLNEGLEVVEIEAENERYDSFFVIKFMDGSYLYDIELDNQEQILTTTDVNECIQFECAEIAQDDADYFMRNHDASGKNERAPKTKIVAPMNEGLDIVEHGSCYIVRFLDGTFFKQYETGKTNRVTTTAEKSKANAFPTYDAAHKTVITIETKFNGAGEREFQLEGGAK